jgi:predicted metal-dependent peptidase
MSTAQLVPYVEDLSVTKAYERAVIQLLSTKPFFAKLVMTMKKDFNFTKYPTAGVSVNSTGICLHINKDFWLGITASERVAILEHEVLHIIHNHTTRFKTQNINDHKLANIACDIAINQYINGLPTKMMIKSPDGSFREGHPVTYEMLKTQFPQAQPKQSSEYYFQFLKEEQNKMKGQGDASEGMETVDDHGEWDESDLTEEQKERFVKSHVKAVAQSCSAEELKDIDKTIIDALYKSDVNWKQILRQFFANSEEIFTERTRKKRNRRYGISQAGIKNECKLKLAVACDTSGSMSDEELNIIFAEISRMYDETRMVIHVIEADSVIRDCYEYKKGMKIEAKGRSGTAYNPAINKAEELGVDGMIYMGDLDSADAPIRPKFSILWAAFRKESNPFPFGKFMKVS